MVSYSQKIGTLILGIISKLHNYNDNFIIKIKTHDFDNRYSCYSFSIIDINNEIILEKESSYVLTESLPNYSEKEIIDILYEIEDELKHYWRDFI